jgi:hypothetical protein
MPIAKTCEQCGTGFSIKPSHAKQRFCSKACVTAYEALHGRVAAQVAETEFSCRECGKPFFYKPAYLTEYRKKFNKDPMYCSVACSHLGRRKTADEKHKANCKNCGKEFYKTRRKGSGTIYSQQELCSKQCKNEWTSKLHRERHGLPQITRRVRRRYTLLRIPARDGRPTYEILEHRYNMEQHIERELLPEETVHHINGDRFDNRIENLELFSSRHGPGQRIADKVQFAIEILTAYPEFCRAAGYSVPEKLHVSDDLRPVLEIPATH